MHMNGTLKLQKKALFLQCATRQVLLCTAGSAELWKRRLNIINERLPAEAGLHTGGLGECYLYGWGTKKDYEKAKYHLKKAARYGYRFCAKQLKGVTPENIGKIDGEKVLEGHRDFYN